jgi:hypothetical protein
MTIDMNELERSFVAFKTRKQERDSFLFYNSNVKIVFLGEHKIYPYKGTDVSFTILASINVIGADDRIVKIFREHFPQNIFEPGPNCRLTRSASISFNLRIFKTKEEFEAVADQEEFQYKKAREPNFCALL